MATGTSKVVYATNLGSFPFDTDYASYIMFSNFGNTRDPGNATYATSSSAVPAGGRSGLYSQFQPDVPAGSRIINTSLYALVRGSGGSGGATTTLTFDLWKRNIADGMQASRVGTVTGKSYDSAWTENLFNTDVFNGLDVSLDRPVVNFLQKNNSTTTAYTHYVAYAYIEVTYTDDPPVVADGLYLGGSKVDKLYVGGIESPRAYLGSDLVHGSTP